jgi:hypothetical protein
MLVMVSNKTRPAMIRIMEIKSMSIQPISIVHKKIYVEDTGKNNGLSSGNGKKGKEFMVNGIMSGTFITFLPNVNRVNYWSAEGSCSDIGPLY